MSNTDNLIPFKVGPDSRRVARGRPSKLADPEFLELFAMATTKGLTNSALAEAFEIDESTVRTWKKDARVKVQALKFTEDRVLRITRKTDHIIEERLQHAADMDVETLLKIRKEFLGGAFRAQTQGVDDNTVNEVMQELEDNPALAQEFREMQTKLSKTKE